MRKITASSLFAAFLLSVFPVAVSAGGLGVWCINDACRAKVHANQVKELKLKYEGLGIRSPELTKMSIESTSAAMAAGSAWYLALDAGLNIFVKDNATGTWGVNATPIIGLKLHWTPAWWTFTPSFLSLGAYVGAGTSSPIAVVPGNTFNVSVLPVITFADYIGFGYGMVAHFATAPGQKNGVSGQMAIAITVPLGTM